MDPNILVSQQLPSILFITHNINNTQFMYESFQVNDVYRLIIKLKRLLVIFIKCEGLQRTTYSSLVTTTMSPRHTRSARNWNVGGFHGPSTSLSLFLLSVAEKSKHDKARAIPRKRKGYGERQREGG